MQVKTGRGIDRGGARTCRSSALRLSLLTCLMTMALAASASAAPPLFWQSQVGESAFGARGVAASPVDGHVFVTDQDGARVVEFTAWGSLVKIWGWDVVESGPDDTAPVNEFEICIPSNGDICKDGTPGAGAGQLNKAMGIAVDSSGNVYVAETITSRRVQKFSSAGQFLLSFGSAGTGPGQFSSPLSIRNEIAITPDDKVWVADNERIQRFNAAGEYQGQVNVPGEDITSLAVDTAGNLYAAYRRQPDFWEAKEEVRKLDATSGAVLQTFKAKNPRGIAVADDGDIYIFDKKPAGSAVPRVLHYDSSGKEVEPPFGDGLEALLPDGAAGLATSSACGIDGTDFFLTLERPKPSIVRAYGPLPDPAICPQPAVPPEIASQYATTVGTDSAALEAKINPRFWPDSTYYLEYGTVDCDPVGSCKTVLLPGVPLTTELVGKALTAHADLEGLELDTTYHFRFVAQSGGGGPVFGPDSTFTTRRVPPTTNPACTNKGLRSGPSAALPDCRAYEMVSPADKNGGDTTAYFYEGLNPSLNLKFNGLDRSTPDGDKLTYSASSSFAGPEGSPLYPQYLARRGAGGWASESIDPAMEGGPTDAGVEGSNSQFKVFSEDLCQGWLIPDSGVPLAPGATEGYRNLYRRDNCTPSPAYTWFESAAAEPEPCVNPACSRPALAPDLQGVARDGECAVFRVNDALTANAPKGLTGISDFTATQLYLKCEGTPVRLVSVLANGTAFNGWSSAGTDNGPLGPGSEGSQNGEGHIDTVQRALSEDGTRVYWTTSSEAFPKLFLRVNADGLLSSTEGTGDFSRIASGKGTVSKESAVITGFSTTTGTFTVGESITGLGIPAGTTIVAIEGSTLTMSKPATADSFPNTTLGSFSRVVGNVTTSTGAFVVGQRIFAPPGSGLPAGATITAVGAGSLTLSIAPTSVKVGVALRATEECTAPDLPCTLQVSPETLSDKAQFWTANPEGTQAIYSIVSGTDAGNLYEYDFNAAEVKGTSTKIAGKTLGVAGSSEDAKRVYFASEEVCSGATPNSEGDVAQADEANLYLYEEGESCAAGQMAFVGTLAGVDISDGSQGSGRPSLVAAVPRHHLSRATADGEQLAFVATAPLTDYDNADVGSGEADREVYLYDAGTGKLICASCNPSGSRPRGANLGSKEKPLWTAAWIPGYQHQLYGRRLITANGGRLFFNSVDALGLRDVNGAQDVYQWEAPGTGDCETSSSSYSAQNEGCVDLISSGQDQTDSEWVEASESGEDVFFRTEESLVKSDPGSVDIYDARVGGGFPEPTPKAACEGDSCQAPPPAPGFQSPASRSFNGPGNPKAQKPRCRKGKVRRKGRCVKRSKHKAHHRAAQANRRAAR